MADTLQAGTPVAVDGSASSSPEGLQLTYSWAFGDSTHGGVVKQAKVYAAAGTYTVTLTVMDSKGRSGSSNHTIKITGAPAGPTVQAQGLVRDVAGQPVAGVTASLVNGTVTATSDAQGNLTLAVPTETNALVKLSKDGYADRFVSLQFPQATGSDAYFEARLLTRESVQSLPDSVQGGTLSGKQGTKITIAGGSLADAAGNAVTGAVQISMTPIDVTGAASGAFPGQFAGVTSAAAATSIVSYGTVEYVLTQNGQRLQLAPGRTASIEIPAYPNANADGSAVTAGQTVPLWSLDETTGLWVQEGEGTVVTSTDSPTGLALSATVGHFSWWNMDSSIDGDYKPKPHCEDAGSGTPGSTDHLANATICNVLAQFDSGGAGGSAGHVAARTVATTATVLRPAFGGTYSIPIGGGTAIALPSNQSMILHGTALNGTWVGQVTVKGGATDTAEVVIPLKAVNAAPPDETITLPVDITRALSAGQTTRLAFTAVGDKPVDIVLASGLGSTFGGQARLLQGSSVVATTTIGNTPSVLNSTLLAAGDYVIEITNTGPGAGTFELQGAYIHWASQGPLIGGLQTVYQLAFTYDAQGRPVLMDAEQYYTSSDNSTASVRLAFRRLVSGVWVAAADSVELGSNGATSCIGFALDRQGNPAYVKLNTDRKSYTANQWTGSAWQTVGPNSGSLPQASDGQGCVSPPDLAFDSSNAPVVGYDIALNGVGAQVLVVRFDGTSWVGMGPNGGLVTPSNLAFSTLGGHSMRLDSTGKPVMEWNVGSGTSPLSQPAYVLRYSDTPTPAWTGVGSASGQLPSPTGVLYAFLQGPNLALDAHDNPLVAAGVLTESGPTPSAMAVLRFDGTQWSASDIHTATSTGEVNYLPQQSQFGLTLDGAGNPLLTWSEVPDITSGDPAYYVQSWSTSGWQGLGSTDGRVDNPTQKLSPLVRAQRDGANNPAIAFVQNPIAAGATISLGVSVYVP